MKTPFLSTVSLAALAALLIPALPGRAQNNDPAGVITQAVVNIVVTDAQGREIPEVPPGMGMPQLIDPAVFRITRTGPTNFAMPVYYSVGGTAANGTDYERLSGTVTIPIGAASASLEVAVIDDFLVEGPESVIVTLEPVVCAAVFPPPPECYRVGTAARATAWIQDNDTATVTNQPPRARFLAPTNGAQFPAPASLQLSVETVDPDGYAATVEFFANNVKIGESTLTFIQPPPPGQPLVVDFQWANVPAGAYSLSARARDDRGAYGSAASISIRVGTNNTPGPTNGPTVVTIVARDAFASEGTSSIGMSNPAVFVVSRTGATNLSLTVGLGIGGTAVNGVDYAQIAQTVSIPAGRRSARVVIQPVDDRVAEPVETVVLTLLPNVAAGVVGSYVIGTPGRAAATISDNDASPVPCVRLPDGLLQLCVPATNGFGHCIEVATNLVDWRVVCTNVVVNGAVHFVDPDAAGHPQRFIRFRPAPAPVDE